MSYHKKSKLNFIQWRLFVLITILWAALFLTACAKKTPAKLKRKAPPTLAQTRRNYIEQLRANGVQVIKLGQTMRIVVLADYLFNPDSANIQRSYRPVMLTLARLMQTYDKVTVKVAAYTSAGNNIKRAQALTTRQAQVVASYLWSRGIDARLTYALGFNQQNPVAWNGDAMGRHFNRRIEISFRFYTKPVPYA